MGEVGDRQRHEMNLSLSSSLIHRFADDEDDEQVEKQSRDGDAGDEWIPEVVDVRLDEAAVPSV